MFKKILFNKFFVHRFVIAILLLLHFSSYGNVQVFGTANNPTLKIAFSWINNDDGAGTDPSFGVDDISLLLPPTDTIITGAISGSPFCACSTVDVPFTSIGTFNAGNTYSAELSDASGSFASPVTIGTLAGIANSGTISGCIIPCNTPSGTAYRIRVISSSPPLIGSDNGADLTIDSSVIASVSITANPGNTICAGQFVTFTANTTNEGSTPSYQWQVNGLNAGSNSSLFTSSSLTNGASVTVTLTSSFPCASPVSVVSTPVIITVNSCNEPVADFSGTPRAMCQAGCVNFTDQSTNSPTTWSWQFPGASPSTSTVQNPVNICYSSIGAYDVTLISSNASGSDTLTQLAYISVGDTAQVAITGNLVINSCEKTELTAVPSDGTYTWGPDVNLSGTSGATVTAAPITTQQYWVTYTSPEGCTDSDTVTVMVTDINTYFLPTALTPNGDGINDEIHLHGRGIESFSLKIFDRIGEQVFQTTSMEKGWNGKLLGVPMNDGVFIYTLNITFCNGERVKKYGDITLVK